MASKIAEAYVQIVPRIDGVASKINSQLSGEMGSAGIKAGDALGGGILSSIKRVAGPMAATLATVGVAKFLKDSITQASNFQAEFEGVNQTFGKFASQVQAYAKTAAQTAGMSEVEALRSAKSFGVFAKSAGLAGADAAKFSTTMVQLAGDLGSFNDVPTAEALAAIQSGLLGQAEPLRRFGILLDDATLRNRALEMGLISTTKNALTPQQKVLAAQAEILAQTNLQQGDFIKYQDDFGNALKTVTSEMDNVKKSVGVAFLPAMTSIVVAVRDNVMPALKNMADGLPALINSLSSSVNIRSALYNVSKSVVDWVNGDGIQTLILGFVQMRMSIVSALAETLPQVLTSIVQAVLRAFPSVVQALLSLIPQLLQTATTLFSSLVTAVTTMIPQLIAAFVRMIPQLIVVLVNAIPQILQGAVTMFLGIITAINTALPQIITALTEAIPLIINTLVNALPQIIAAITNALPQIIMAAVTLFLGLIQGITTAMPQIIVALVAALPQIINTLLTALPKLIDAAFQLFTGIIDGLIKATPQIIDAVVKLIPVIVKVFTDNMPKLIDAGIQILNGLAKGLIDNAPRIIGAAIKGVADIVTGTFKNALGINSPSKVFIGYGENIGEGLADGMDSMQGAVEKSARELGSYANKGFEMSLKELTAAGSYGVLAGTKYFKPSQASDIAGYLNQGGVLDVNGITMADIKAAISADAAGGEKASKAAKKSGESYYSSPAVMALLERAGYTFQDGYSRQLEGKFLQDLSNRLTGATTTYYKGANGREMAQTSSPIVQLTSEFLNAGILAPGYKASGQSLTAVQDFITQQKANLAAVGGGAW